MDMLRIYKKIVDDHQKIFFRLARTPNFVHKSCIITNTNIQTYEKTYRS